MSESIREETSALNSSDFHSGGFEWEWLAVWMLIGFAVLWLWQTRRKTEKERRCSAELCRHSLYEDD